MAVKNFLQTNKVPVGTTSNKPLWEQLGYSSPQAYLNAMAKPASSKATPVVSSSPLNKYAGLTNPSVGAKVTAPSLDTSAIRKNMLDSSKIGIVGGGAIGGNGARNPGTITKEGAIIGGGGNLVSLPSVRQGSSGGKTTSPKTTPSLNNYASIINAQRELGYTQPTISPVPTSTPQNFDTNTPARTDEGSYNGTSDFLEAFKENYGYDYDGNPLTRREGMSDGTWNALQSLYKYYQQGQDDEAKRDSEIASENQYYQGKEDEISQAFDASRQTLGENKGKAQQNASISLDKLLKYLPAQAKAQGYEGLGTSESSALQAYANYNNNMGDIASDYNSKLTALDQSEISEKGDLAKQKKDSLTSINDKYDAYERARNEAAGADAQAAWEAYEAERKAKEEQLRQEASAKETQTYEEYRDMLNYSTSTDYDSLVRGIDSLSVSEEYKRLLKDKARIVADANLKKQTEDDENKRKSESEALYNSVADSVAVKIESAMGDDGKISQSDYQAIVDYVNGYKGKLDDGQIARLMTSLEANQSYVRNEQEEQEATKQDGYHSIKTSDVDFNNNGGWWIFGSTDFSSGDNFSVKDSSGFKYRIESGGEVADSEIAEAAYNVGNNQVFGYGGKIYLKRGGKIYLIQKRANSYEGHFNKLYAKFYG